MPDTPTPSPSTDHATAASSGRRLTELGFYGLAGQPESTRDLVDEVRTAEALGLGSVFLSERFDKKEIGVLSGAAGAVSEELTVVTAATNHNTRHPMITAGLARSMQSLTGGRFVLGLGRGIPIIQDTYGIPRITTAALEDFAGIMKRLFRGEFIVGHDGPAGSWPVLYLAADRRGPAARPGGLRTPVAGPGRSLLRRGHPAHLLHRGDHAALCGDGQGGGRAGRSGPGRRSRCGRAWPPSATTSPRTSG